MSRRPVTRRSSGTPYYRAVGARIDHLNQAGVYEPAAVIDPADDAQGTPEEIAAEAAKVLDVADLNRDRGAHTREAQMFYLATHAPGFRWTQ
jgi:hypothetical protein